MKNYEKVRRKFLTYKESLRSEHRKIGVENLELSALCMGIMIRFNGVDSKLKNFEDYEEPRAKRFADAMISYISYLKTNKKKAIDEFSGSIPDGNLASKEKAAKEWKIYDRALGGLYKRFPKLEEII